MTKDEWKPIRQTMVELFNRNPERPISDGLYLEVLGVFDAAVVRECVFGLVGKMAWVPTPTDLKRAVLDHLSATAVAPRFRPTDGEPATERQRVLIALAYENAQDALPGEGAADLATNAITTADPTLTAAQLEQDVAGYVKRWLAWFGDPPPLTRFDSPQERDEITAYVQEHGVAAALRHYAPFRSFNRKAAP